MKESENRFTSEAIESQTERSSEELSPGERRLIHDLYAGSQAYAQANARSLERIWSRFVQRQEDPALLQERQQHTSGGEPLFEEETTRQEKPIHGKTGTSLLPSGSAERPRRKRAGTAILSLSPEDMAALTDQEQRPKPVASTAPALFKPPHARHTRRVVSFLSALVAVLLIAVVVTAIIASRSALPKSTIAHPGATSTTASAVPSPQENLYLTAPLVKLDTKTRHALWTYTWLSPQAPEGESGHLLVGDGSVYFFVGSGSISRSLYAVNSMDGALRWRNTTLGADAAFLLVEPGVVYVTAGAAVYALNAGDGSVRWHTPVSGSTDELVLAQGVLYGTTSDTPAGHLSSRLFAVNAADGSLLWQTALPAGKSFMVSAIVNGTLYLSSVELKNQSNGALSVMNGGQPIISYVYAYSSEGTLLWKSQQFDDDVLSLLTVVAGVIYFSGTGVYALSAKDGSLLWEYPVATGVGVNGPVFANGTVYLESEPNNSSSSIGSFLIALDGQTGHVQWKQKIADAGAGGGPYLAVGNGFLYIDYLDPKMYPSSLVEAFNAGDGSFAWQTSVNAYVTSFIAAP